MPACDLQVVLDRADRAYRPGEAVRGEVVVTADREVPCRGLEVELLWQTRGVGNTDRRVVDRLALGPQAWGAGCPYRYPFAFTAPSAPLTYRGQILSVDHAVAARADLPWKVDARASEGYLLLPGPGSRDDYLAAAVDFTGTPPGKSGPMATAVGWLLAPLVLLMLLALLVVALPVVLVVCGVILLRRHLAERRLGRVTVELDAPEVGRPAASGPLAVAGRVGAWLRPAAVRAISPGEAVRCRVRFRPRGGVEVERVTARLLASERCSTGSGKHRRTETHTLCDVPVVLAERLPGMAGAPVELAAELAVPDIEAFSFRAAENAVEWKLETRVEVARWPDWVRAVPLALVPGPAAR